MEFKLLPLNELGGRSAPDGTAEFGIFLPWVSASDGNRLKVKVIHEKDQFLQDIQPMVFEMEHSVRLDYGDYWSAKIEIDEGARPHPDSAWGKPGRYVYRYSLENPSHPDGIDWIIDPFAREFGIGKLSAFTLGYEQYAWNDNEGRWKIPDPEDLIMYELMISEFGGSVENTVERLGYLADLGVNCIEVMPVSNVSLSVDWGFLPIGYFGIDERFGNRKNLQRLIDHAHQAGIAVILDAVYGHTSDSFPYCYLYRQLGYKENPFMGPFAKDYFGESTDFAREFTRDFFFTVNYNWLDVYHVDGFRYDCVPNYWDGPAGVGYSDLVYKTYMAVKGKEGLGGHWQRFFNNGSISLIQCAEQLEAPQEVLNTTYSTSTWQNGTLSAATSAAKDGSDAPAWLTLTWLGLELGLQGYPTEIPVNGDVIKKTALQYIENHDHSRFICNFGTNFLDDGCNDLMKEGKLDLWYKVQPYLIGIFAAKGTPMLWQGQEFGENYFVPDTGMGRVAMFRPVRWDYFYTPVGKSTVRLVRSLIKIRRSSPQLRKGDHFFYNDPDRYQSKNVLLFSRSLGDAFSLVALNFGDQDQTVPFTFQVGGDYVDELHGQDRFRAEPGREISITVPSNYGRIWTTKAGA